MSVANDSEPTGNRVVPSRRHSLRCLVDLPENRSSPNTVRSTPTAPPREHARQDCHSFRRDAQQPHESATPPPDLEFVPSAPTSGNTRHTSPDQPSQHPESPIQTVPIQTVPILKRHKPTHTVTDHAGQARESNRCPVFVRARSSIPVDVVASRTRVIAACIATSPADRQTNLDISAAGPVQNRAEPSPIPIPNYLPANTRWQKNCFPRGVDWRTDKRRRLAAERKGSRRLPSE